MGDGGKKSREASAAAVAVGGIITLKRQMPEVKMEKKKSSIRGVDEEEEKTNRG